jgi:hypothetical protein
MLCGSYWRNTQKAKLWPNVDDNVNIWCFLGFSCTIMRRYSEECCRRVCGLNYLEFPLRKMNTGMKFEE